jgi:hypothetical protein
MMFFVFLFFGAIQSLHDRDEMTERVQQFRGKSGLDCPALPQTICSNVELVD